MTVDGGVGGDNYGNDGDEDVENEWGGGGREQNQSNGSAVSGF